MKEGIPFDNSFDLGLLVIQSGSFKVHVTEFQTTNDSNKPPQEITFTEGDSIDPRELQIKNNLVISKLSCVSRTGKILQLLP
jgi:hypothetical protein